MDPKDTRRKIQRLLEELRSWAPGESRRTLQELVEEYALEIFVVEQVARSEGFEWVPRKPAMKGPTIDPDASTIDLDPEAVAEAMGNPESDPRYLDRDTGVWRKKPTGEWELVTGVEGETD